MKKTIPIDLKHIEVKDMPYIIPNSKIQRILSNKLNGVIEKYIEQYPELDITDCILKMCEDNKVRYDDIEEYILDTNIIKNLREQNANTNTITKMGLF